MTHRGRHAVKTVTNCPLWTGLRWWWGEVSNSRGAFGSSSARGERDRFVHIIIFIVIAVIIA